MEIVGRTHKNIVTTVFFGQTEIGKHTFILCGNKIDLRLRSSFIIFRFAFYVYAVLIGSGEKKCIKTTLLFIALDDIRNGRCIKMT